MALKIEALDDKKTYFSYTDSINTDLHISFAFHDMITLNGTINGGWYNQVFKSATHSDYRRAISEFSTITKTIEKAINYKDGVTNKEKFIKEVDRLISQNFLESSDRAVLVDFIQGIFLKPSAIRNQLLLRGYGKIAKKMDFEDDMPELLITCQTFLKFLTQLA